MKITDITAQEIKDSRTNPTLSVTVICEDGSQGTFDVPSGASTGATEACELRDGPESYAHVQHAIDHVTGEIKTALVGREVTNQRDLDETMLALDGTPQKSRLGGNAIIGVSVAACKAAAKSEQKELFSYLKYLSLIPVSHHTAPYLFMNLVNGGKHAKSALAFQEYMIVPQTENLQDAYDIGLEVMHLVDQTIIERYGQEKFVVGDEGGVALDVPNVEVPLQILSEIRDSHLFKAPFSIALDIAATSFFANGLYQLGDESIDKEAFSTKLVKFAADYKLISIEDPFEETDSASFHLLKEQLPNVKIVGDDLTTTNATRIKDAIASDSISAVIIKPNQVGTVTETLDAMLMAREKGIDCIVSHRSGETHDTFIADLAFAFGTFGIKVGAPRKPERLAKIERLIQLSHIQTIL